MCNSRNGTKEVFMETKPRNENWGVSFLHSKITERPWKPLYNAGREHCCVLTHFLPCCVCGAERCMINSWNSHCKTEKQLNRSKGSGREEWYPFELSLTSCSMLSHHCFLGKNCRIWENAEPGGKHPVGIGAGVSGSSAPRLGAVWVACSGCGLGW